MDSNLFEFKYVEIDDITAVCKINACPWSGTGEVKVEVRSEMISESPLVQACRDHHQETRFGRGGLNDHNQFYFLDRVGKKRGFASVSFGSCSGIFELE